MFNGDLVRTYTCFNCGGQPIITNDAVIINSDDGVKIFDKVSMELIQTLDISGMIALSGNRLFVTDKSNGAIKAYLFDVNYRTTTTTTPSPVTLKPTPSPVTIAPSEKPTKRPTTVVNRIIDTKTPYNDPGLFETSTTSNGQQTIYRENGFNSTLIICIVIAGAIIFVVGILIGCGVIKYKMRKQMAQMEGEGVMIASVDNNKEPGSNVTLGEGMNSMLLNQEA